MPDDPNNKLSPVNEDEPSDAIVTVLTKAIDAFNRNLEVTKLQIEYQHTQQGVERMRIEKEFESRKDAVEKDHDVKVQSIEARKQAIADYYAYERYKFDRLFWALMIFGGLFFAIVIALMALANDFDQRVKVFASAVGFIVVLLGGKGLADMLRARSVKPEE